VTGLEVQEAILAEEQAHNLHPPDGWDLSVELGQAHARVDGINGECAVEAGQLSQLVMGIFHALVDLDMLHILDIPQLPKSARDVLAAASLVLERLREA
jgi:hypothetical protein